MFSTTEEAKKWGQGDRTSVLTFLEALEIERAIQETSHPNLALHFPRIPRQATKLHTREHLIEPLYTRVICLANG